MKIYRVELESGKVLYFGSKAAIAETLGKSGIGIGRNTLRQIKIGGLGFSNRYCRITSGELIRKKGLRGRKMAGETSKRG